jgi:hypothetical protein
VEPFESFNVLYFDVAHPKALELPREPPDAVDMEGVVMGLPDTYYYEPSASNPFAVIHVVIQIVIQPFKEPQVLHKAFQAPVIYVVHIGPRRPFAAFEV